MLESMPLGDADLPRNIRRLTRAEYDKIVDTGVLNDFKCELLDGLLVAKVSPQGAPHAALTRRLAAMLRDAATRNGMEMTIGAPFAATDDSEPEPDLALVTSEAAFDRREHPSRAFLLVEVCHTTDHNDRVVKTRIYARAGVPEYWIVDVDDKTIEIYTKPRGHRYDGKRVVSHGTVAPSALPDALVDLAELFR